MEIRAPQFGAVFAAHSEGSQMAQFAHVVWAETVAGLVDCKAIRVNRKARLATVERYARYRAEYQFNYAVCMKDGPVNRPDNGGEYVNMSWAMLNKLDERLLKYDAVLASWTKGIVPKDNEGAKLREPAGADKYLARSSGQSIEEYRKANGIRHPIEGDTP